MKTINYFSFSITPTFSLKGNLISRAFSLLIIICCLPIMLINVLWAIVKRSPSLLLVHKRDALGRTIALHYFSHGVFKKSALLFDILRGELNFIGVHFSDSLPIGKQKEINDKYTPMPGIFSFYTLHKASGLISDTEEQLLLQTLNSNFIQRQCLIIKSLLCTLLYADNGKTLKNNKIITLFGLSIANITIVQAVNWIITHHDISPKVGFFINVQSINLGLTSSTFLQQLHQADALFADGSGMRLATKKAGYQLADNNNGTDMLPPLCKGCIEHNKSIFLLGAKEGVAQKAAQNLTKQHPGLIVAGVQHGYTTAEDNHQLITQINNSQCDILLVALGSPIQESWILKNKDQLKCQTILAVGGLFDFYSGEISRSPLWLRELGLEWIWRLIQEPKSKFYRYVVGNPLFLFRIYFLGLATKGEK